MQKGKTEKFFKHLKLQNRLKKGKKLKLVSFCLFSNRIFDFEFVKPYAMSDLILKMFALIALKPKLDKDLIEKDC